MPSKRFPPDDPREWLNRARSNLAKARSTHRTPEIYLEDLCFDAQQAAEKAIKAILIHLDVYHLRSSGQVRRESSGRIREVIGLHVVDTGVLVSEGFDHVVLIR